MAGGKTTTNKTTTSKSTITFTQLQTTGSVKEDDVLSVLGTMTAVDSDPAAKLTWSIKSSATGNYGTLSLAADGTWKYVLANAAAAVQSLTSADLKSDSFTVQVVDSFGTSVTKSIVVSVAGTSEKPVISVAAGADHGAVAEDGVSKASGQFGASSVEKNATLAWSAVDGGAGKYGTLSVDKTGGWTYLLDDSRPEVQALVSGQQVVETLAVMVADGTGQFSTANVTVTIDGEDDAPVVVSDAAQAAGVVVEDGVTTAQGQLAATSPDAGATLAWSSVQAGGKGDYGWLTIDPDGAWTYTLDNSDPAVQALVAGGTLADAVSVQVSDDKGMSTKVSVAIEIQGADDEVAPPAPPPDTTGGTGGNGTNSGGVNSGKKVPVDAVSETTVVDATTSYVTYTAPNAPVSTYAGPNPFTTLSGTAAVQAEVTNALFGATPGISVDASTFHVVSGASSVMHYDGNLPLGIGAGLLLTSGGMPGTVNSAGWFSVDNGMSGDADLNQIVQTVFPTTGYDATTVSFSFTVDDPTITGIRFNTVFGSDEYPEWVDTIFVDIGAVIVNGTNVALFDPANPKTPLSIIGSNLSANYFIDNTDGHLPIEYDGVTRVLDVFAPVHQGVNTIKLGISDTGDHIYDSALFISNLTGTTYDATGVYLDHSGTDQSETQSGGVEAEVYDAQGGDDTIYAQGGNDVVLGGAGNDVLDGGGGADKMQGGAGADRFLYEKTGDSAPGASDTIVDFSALEGDVIDVSMIDADVSTAADDAFTWVAALGGQAGELAVLAQAGGGWRVDADVDGDGVADLSIVVTGTMAPQAADFVL